MNAQQQLLRRQRRRSFPRSRTGPRSTARMVRGATVGTASAAAPLASFAGIVGTGMSTNDGHPLGSGKGLDDENGTHRRQQQPKRERQVPPQQPQQPQQQQQQPAWGEQQKQPQEVQAHTGSNKNGDVGEPTAAEWEAMVLERVSRMGLGDDDNNHTGGNGESSGVPSPAATSNSTSTSISIFTSTPTPTPIPAASVEDPVQVTITAPIARPPARRFRVRTAGTTSATTNQSITGIDGTSMHQSRESNNSKTNKRDAADLTATPVTNNQTTRPGDQTPPPTVGSHPLLLLGNVGSTSTSTAGLLPRLSPPLGLQSPTTANINANLNTNDSCKYIHATASSASSSPTSTTATPTVTAQMLSCSIPTTTTTTTIAISTTTTQQQLSADGTSLTIEGGPDGGPRKRRMLKKRHRRSNASFLLAGAAFGCGVGGGGGGTSDGAVTDDVGCLGGILPDLAGIFDGACGGGTEDVFADGGNCTPSTSNAYANGIGGRSGPHPLAAGGCGSSSSSFPDPFGLVTKARRGRNRSPRPSSTTLGSGGTSSQGSSSSSSRFARTNFSPVPHPLARPKRPSAPTPPGAGMMSQSSSVFDRRLDRLASGVQMPSSKGTSTTAGDSSSGSGMPAPPNLVPKFRASPLLFSANLHVTPQPRRATASRQHAHHGKSTAASGGGRNATAGRRVRGGTKPGSNMGATLTASTGFGASAAFAAPSSSSRGSTPVPPPGNGGAIPAPPPTPIGTML